MIDIKLVGKPTFTNTVTALPVYAIKFPAQRYYYLDSGQFGSFKLDRVVFYASKDRAMVKLTEIFEKSNVSCLILETFYLSSKLFPNKQINEQ